MHVVILICCLALKQALLRSCDLHYERINRKRGQYKKMLQMQHFCIDHVFMIIRLASLLQIRLYKCTTFKWKSSLGNIGEQRISFTKFCLIIKNMYPPQQWICMVFYEHRLFVLYVLILTNKYLNKSFIICWELCDRLFGFKVLVCTKKILKNLFLISVPECFHITYIILGLYEIFVVHNTSRLFCYCRNLCY